jgi:ABC-type multidrug transport system ATPase subunit
MTIIVISHRLKSLSWVDRFVLLDAGTIVAEGDHATLMRESCLYRMLLDAEPDFLESDGGGRAAANPAANGFDATYPAAARTQ